MARATQSRIKRYKENLRKNTFLHNNSDKYVFNCWNTKRNGKGTSYTDEEATAFDKDITLYAIWRERAVLTKYENLTISAPNAAYSEEYVVITYSLYEVKYYEGNNVVISKTLKTGTTNSSIFGKNGDPTSTVATSAKTHTLTYTAKSFPNVDAAGKTTYLTATKDITQYGYTPTYRINVVYDASKINVIGRQSSTSNTLLLKTNIDENMVRISSTTKQIVLQIDSTKNKNYHFVCWKGSGINGNTNTQITVEGSLQNYKTVEATCKLNPLTSNELLVNNYWYYGYYSNLYYYHYWYNISYYRFYKNLDLKYNIDKVSLLPYTITAPATGKLKVKGRYGIYLTDHFWNWHLGYYPYYYNYYYRSYYHYDYWWYYLYNIRFRKHGFNIKLNNNVVKKYSVDYSDSKYYNNSYIYDFWYYFYLHNYWTSYYKYWNIENQEFEYEIQVKKGDVLNITSTYCDIENYYYTHCAILLDSVEIEEQIPNYSSINIYDRVKLADNLSNYKKLLDDTIKNNGEYGDNSIEVVKKGEMRRDQDHLPKYTTTYSTGIDLEIVKIAIYGCHGYGYTKQLKITDISDNSKNTDKVIFNSEYAPFGGELINRVCYIYMPSYSKILIDACWHRVDTLNFGVTLTINSISLPNSDYTPYKE